MSDLFNTSDQIVAAYENGLPGWQFNPATMDALMADRKALLFAEAAPHLAGIGKGKMALLWRSREKYDPGAFGQEPQTRGSCFVPGTLVRMADGREKPIETVEKGERVLSHAGEPRVVI